MRFVSYARAGAVGFGAASKIASVALIQGPAPDATLLKAALSASETD